MHFEVLRSQSEGLSEEQLEDLDHEIRKYGSEGGTTEQIIKRIKDFLGDVNSSSRKVILHENLQKEAE